jgi:protocatechuate 3,4-dioxygenase beta subunit
MRTSNRFSPRPLVGRRAALRTIGAGLAAIPIVGCNPAASVVPDSGTGDVDADPGEPDAGASTWASGGTAAMTDAASYPNPFGAPGSACALTLGATLGPCFHTSPERRDVSEGYPGLPVRLAFRVVDEACAPIAGARVDIWHTRNNGIYSGGPIDFCTTGDPDAIAHLYFRGAQVSDAEGIVLFDTCFPGWYRGRAIHIHLQVLLPGGTKATTVSQVFFAEGLITEVFATHPDYATYGQPDTPNPSDGIYAGIGASGIVETARMTDGAMLAWKQIVVRTP